MKNKNSFKCLTNSEIEATRGYKCLTNSEIEATRGYRCLTNSEIMETESYSFCTQCMDQPIIDEEGYCEICSALVDDEKEFQLLDKLTKQATGKGLLG